MASWTPKRTILGALAEVKLVFDGATGVRLIDERYAQSSASDCLITIKDTPDAVVRETLDFDCYAPGIGEKVTRRCPVPGCKGKIVFNKDRPAPGVTPLPPCLTDGLTSSTSP